MRKAERAAHGERDGVETFRKRRDEIVREIVE
jgi:hypothetical protein